MIHERSNPAGSSEPDSFLIPNRLSDSRKPSEEIREDFDSVLDPIDILLDVLPEAPLSFSAQAIASNVFETESRRVGKFSIVRNFVALSISTILVLIGWKLGTDVRGNESSVKKIPTGIEQFQGLFSLKIDDMFVDALIDNDQPCVWDTRESVDPQDTQSIAKLRATIDSNDMEALKKSVFSTFLNLEPAQRDQWTNLAHRIDALSPEHRTLVHNRLAGMRITFASLTEAERRRSSQMNGKARWNFLVQRAENLKKAIEQTKRPAFSVSEFNRPDYLMDLALVARTWNKMTPAQKRAAERRAMTSKADPTRKLDRIRLLAQNLEQDGPDTIGVKPGQAKQGPLMRAIAKADAIKQERDKRRSDYQKIMTGAIPAESVPEELERFLRSLPPWLIESVDPLPPDEARRFLSLLKVLADHQDEEHETAQDAR